MLYMCSRKEFLNVHPDALGTRTVYKLSLDESAVSRSSGLALNDYQCQPSCVLNVFHCEKYLCSNYF
jgi:hypothetical protein